MDEVPPGPPVSRRNLLKGIGAGALTLVVIGTGAVTYRAVSNRVLDYNSGQAYDPWRDWQDHPGPLGMVAAAILAANPHNTQPWIFQVSDRRIDLFNDPPRSPGVLDALGREQLVGLGCALENMGLAAGPRGYSAAVTVLPDSDPTHVASVVLTPSATAPASSLYTAIGERRSNRGPYQSTSISAQDLRSLGAQVPSGSELGVRWFTTPSERADVGAIMIDAASAIVADRQQSVDGFRWFRSTEAAIEQHRDGLTDWGQDLPDLISSAAALLPGSSRTAGDQFWLTQTKTVHTKTAAAYGVITAVDANDARTRIDGGRLLQRLHLAATAAGMGFQHMNQITERIDRQASQGRVSAFAARYDALVGQPGRSPLVSFRIGYPVRSGRMSPRRPLAWVVR